MMSTLQALAAQLAPFLALLLAAAAIHKASGWSRSVGVARQFGGLPDALAPAALGATVGVELAAGVLLLIPSFRAVGAWLAAAMWTLYLALIVRAIVRNQRDVDCGCSFGSTARPLGSFHVARNIVLASLAVFVALAASLAGSVTPRLSQLLGGFALLALYGALDQVMALQPLRSGEVL